MTDADPARLLAELWYEEVPDLEDPRLLAALREVSSEAELQDRSITIPHPEFTMELEEGVMPLLTAVLPGSALGVDGKSLPDVSQTWDWAEVSTALEGCTGSVLVTELLAHLFPPQQRVTGLTAVLAVLVEQTHPRAIYWPQSQRVTDPADFETEALDGIINVRFFTVDSDEPAMLMDTLGLDLFELPDVQCHYRDFNPADVATMLYNTAVYLFSQGDVIDDGHTISGPRGDERFVCRHEDALIGPDRIVLDVDLGEPYAAGERVRS
ncbi:MAG: DUF4261 domain-containing protein [Propionibacteriaceae bacterium]